MSKQLVPHPGRLPVVRAFLLAGALLPAVVAAAPVYRCEGGSGEMLLTDKRAGNRNCQLVFGQEEAPPSRTAARVATAGGSGRGAPAALVTPPGFVDEAVNVLEFRDPAVFAPFFAKWARGPAQRIGIAHFGDSHVHGGFSAEAARRVLQARRGDGGRGLVFPFALARASAASDFRSAGEGSWSAASSVKPNPALPLGMTGFAARAERLPAAFSVRFHQAPAPGPRTVKVFFKSTAPGLRLVASSGAQRQVFDPAWSAARALPYAEFHFPALTDTLRVEAEGGRGSFELHGVSLESDRPGLVYHSLGVDGAGFGALLAQAYFADQAAALAPDLYVLDWGTNDILTNAIPPNHKQVVLQSIRKIRALNPDSVIVLTSVQDMDFQGRNLTVARDYAALMREIALEQGCLFYDWYRVAGGPGSMRAWRARGLGGKDNLHLTARGYQLKGELFAKALLATVDRYAQSPRNIR